MEKKIQDKKSIKINDNLVNLRIDKAICICCPEYSRSFIQKSISSGLLTINGEVKNKNYVVKQNDIIEISFEKPKELDLTPQDIPLDIVYEDDDLIVINKPKGIVVHPAPGNYDNTLVNALLHHCKDSLSGIGGIVRPGIVHRIDKNTSGLLVIAKNDNAHIKLSEQLKNHSMDRVYHSIVFGNFKEKSGIIHKMIGRNPNDRKKMAVVSKNGKNAVTHYEVLKEFNGYSYVKLNLETGRTHQIRVHMASIGHFVIGDDIYGRKVKNLNLDFEGQCLHAKTLGFIHPTTDEKMFFDSELPDYFKKTLTKLDKML